MKFKHWKLDTDTNNVIWATLDRADQSVNSLNDEVILELEKVVETVEQTKNCSGLVIKSGKANSFIVGADIRQFTELKNAKQAREVIERGHAILDRLEKLKVPTVAMINGVCLGGGAELALACKYIVGDADKTVIGLPEVKLGIYPGWGGSVRLPRRVGAIKSMGAILPGRAFKAKQAYKMGFIDSAVPARQLKRTVEYFIENTPKHKHPTTIESLTNHRWVRGLLSNQFEKQLNSKIRESQYPAPFAVVRNWVRYGVGRKAFKGEAKAVSELLLSSTSKNLVRAFFLQERMKGLAKNVDFNPKHLHVVGAGVMGGDIAAWAARQGMKVTLQDQKPEFISGAIQRAYKFYKKKLKEPRKVQEAMDNLQPDVKGYGIYTADVIIEAVVEKIEVKQEIFKDLENKARPDAILASNTSSISIDEISKKMEKPSRLMGVHFFNPVSVMMLVEVVKGDKTDVDLYNKGIAFVRKINRLPLPVNNYPGFLVNRILMPYLFEGMLMLDEGYSVNSIDEAAESYGMPMGPLKLADHVGLDICIHVARILAPEYGVDIPKCLSSITDQGNIGKKSGQGFYKYKKGKLIANKNPTKFKKSKDLTDRLIFAMLNEAVSCLRQKVVADHDLLDAGMIFGAGFAPFRGGPMQYIKTEGADKLRSRLEKLEKKYGERFTPDKGWSALKFDKVDC